MMYPLAAASLPDDFCESLVKVFQSGNINFLIGSGASMPAIPVGGNIEAEIQDLLDKGKTEEAKQKIYEFLWNLNLSSGYLQNGWGPPALEKEPKAEYEKRLAAFKEAMSATCSYYIEFLRHIEHILNERRTSLLPKQANIFTTNYDLFVEYAADHHPSLKLNDGFVRTPQINARYEYNPKCFFNSLYNFGNLYNYKVEVPTINTIKIHGSLSWARSGDSIVFSPTKNFPAVGDKEYVEKFNNCFAVVLPRKEKFRETLLDRIHYDLLRIYANELDKENTILISFGFSFGDEHILDITKRALKNPTLKLIIFNYSEAQCFKLQKVFEGFKNVDFVWPSAGVIDFPRFNSIMASVLASKTKV